MDRIALKALLDNNLLDQDQYSLYGGLPNETYCIDYNEQNKCWEVYYSERGSKSSLKEFNTENDACSYFFKLINNGQ